MFYYRWKVGLASVELKKFPFDQFRTFIKLIPFLVDDRAFGQGLSYTALTGGAATQQMVQQVQLPVSAVPTISNPNGIWILNGAQILPNAQLGLCYYSVNQQVGLEYFVLNIIKLMF